MKFWHLLHLQLNNQRQHRVKMLPWASHHCFFPAAPWTKDYISLVCFSHHLFVVLICFLFYLLNLILLCSRYWKIPCCSVVFTENFFHSHTHCNSFDTCRRQAYHGYCSYELWNTYGNMSTIVVCVLSIFVAWLQILLTWSIFHPCFHSWFSFLFKFLYVSDTQFSSLSCKDLVFLCKREACSACAINLSNFWRV